MHPGQAGAALDHRAATVGLPAVAGDHLLLPVIIVIYNESCISNRHRVFADYVTCHGVCLGVAVLPGQGQAGAGLACLLSLLPAAPQAEAAPRAPRAPQGAARVSVAHRRVPGPVLVILVIKNHVAEHQEVLGGPTSLRGLRLRLEKHHLEDDHSCYENVFREDCFALLFTFVPGPMSIDFEKVTLTKRKCFHYMRFPFVSPLLYTLSFNWK